jgi:hypothetical protein
MLLPAVIFLVAPTLAQEAVVDDAHRSHAHARRLQYDTSRASCTNGVRPRPTEAWMPYTTAPPLPCAQEEGVLITLQRPAVGAASASAGGSRAAAFAARLRAMGGRGRQLGQDSSVQVQHYSSGSRLGIDFVAADVPAALLPRLFADPEVAAVEANCILLLHDPTEDKLDPMGGKAHAVQPAAAVSPANSQPGAPCAPDAPPNPASRSRRAPLPARAVCCPTNKQTRTRCEASFPLLRTALSAQVGAGQDRRPRRHGRRVQIRRDDRPRRQLVYVRDASYHARAAAR